ncbi:MAG TPA: hypothetical protein ENG93_01185, partial [Nitrospirae bacterium]|nr:hypothetical protein [Nitrospirota bacterium]
CSSDLDDQDYSSGLGIAGSDTEGLHFWNFGVRANAQPMDNLSLKADVELQKGKAKLNRVDLSGNPADREFSGYAWLIGADLDLNDTYALNAEAAYGSGDKVDYSPAAATDPSGEKFEGFVTSLGGSQHYTYVYEYRTASAAGAKGTGLTNTWYLNLGASAKATSDISVSTDLYFLRAAKAVAIGGALNSDGTLNTSKKLGTEIDAKIEYQIEKNLVYYVEGGYLFTGDAYDYPQVCSSTSCPIPGGGSVLQGDEIPGANETSDNAYAVRNGLMLSF